VSQVTWIMPVLNGMPFLRDTLASIEQQSDMPASLLVWDNGSTDGTLEELHAWIPARIPGKVIAGARYGVGGALRELVKLATTKYCARIDADDIALPDRLARQVAFLDANPQVAVVGSQLEVMDETGKSTGRVLDYPSDHEGIVLRSLLSNPMGHPSVMFRRDAVLEVGNYRELPNVEDYDLWLRLAGKHQFANLPEPLTRYRVHDRSCTQKDMKQMTLQGKMDDVLVEHAPDLFGWSRETAADFRARRIDCMLTPAIQLAGHRAGRAGLSKWRYLKSPKLLDALGSQLRPRDLLSRLSFGMLDPRPRSTLSAIKSVTLSIAQKFKPASRLLSAWRCWQERRRFSNWLRQQRLSKCYFDPRVEVTGRKEGYAWIKTAPEVTVERDVTLWISEDDGAEPEIHIGTGTFIGRNAYLGAFKPLYIGSDVLVGAYSYLITGNHQTTDRQIPIQQQGFAGAPITVGNGAWLGTHVVVLPGVSIGEGAIVAAGSVVTSSIPAWEIWGGVPAKFIKNRP